MKKITLFLSAMLFSLMSMAQTTVKMDFTTAEGLDALGIPQPTVADGSAYKTDLEVGSVYTQEGVTFTATKHGSAATRIWKTTSYQELRHYKGGVITIGAPAGKVITKIELTGYTDVIGFENVTDGVWEGSLSSVDLTAEANAATIKIQTITVTLGEGGGDNPGGDDPNPGTGDVVEITGLQYADAYYYEYEGIKFYDIDLYKNLDEESYDYIYPELYIIVEANSKTALNGTYDLLFAGLWASENDSVMIGEEVGTVTIKNTDNEGNYSFKGSYVGEDGKTYKFDQVVNVYAYDADADYEDITLNENGGDTPGDDDPVTPPAGGGVTFDADVDKGNATETRAAYEVAKEGITMSVTDGRLGTYNNEVHYRIYKSATMTLTSTVGNIVSVEFTCTANDDAEYGPAHFTVDSGNYTYAGAMGTWTGNASTVVFTATTAQVRATQIVVKIAGGTTGVEDVTTVVIPVKVMQNGQVLIIRGENVYNVLGAQVK